MRITSYLELTRLVGRAKSGDSLAAWEALAKIDFANPLHSPLLGSLLPIIGQHARDIVSAAAQPQGSNPRKALTALRKAVGIDGQRAAPNVQRARRNQEIGLRAAWSAIHHEAANAIQQKRDFNPPSSAALAEIAAQAAGVDVRTARRYELPRISGHKAARLQPKAAPGRKRAVKPKSWQR